MATSIKIPAETFHAHVYFNAKSKRQATQLRSRVKRAFKITDKSRNYKLGRMHDKPVGPHPCPMYLIWFKASQYGQIVPWLSFNRKDLSILVHPQLDKDVVADHTDHAVWLGKPLRLRLSRFSGKARAKRGF